MNIKKQISFIQKQIGSEVCLVAVSKTKSESETRARGSAPNVWRV